MFLPAEAISGFLPLLLSTKYLKAVDISLQLKDGFLKLGDDLSGIRFETVSSGHFVIDVVPKTFGRHTATCGGDFFKLAVSFTILSQTAIL